MKSKPMLRTKDLFRKTVVWSVIVGLHLPSLPAFAAATPLADQPIVATVPVPANVMLDLSVEWPTGNVQAHNDEVTGTCPGRDGNSDSICYFTNQKYIGYFDPTKCYRYNFGGNYFEPAANAAANFSCAGRWSGNFLNWATMQTVDMFRWAMTGGDRFIDTTTLTVLEKARHDGTGGFNQFPLKRVGGAVVGAVTPVAPSSVTPFSDPQLFLRVQGLNTIMWIGRNRSTLTVDHPEPNNPNNTLSVPAVSTVDEDGTCAAYTGGAPCTDLPPTPGTRQIVTTSTSAPVAGQCSGFSGTGTCVNVTPATRQFQRVENATNCSGRTVGTVVTISGISSTVVACAANTPSSGRRTVTYQQSGNDYSCTNPGLPSGFVSGSCGVPIKGTYQVTTSSTSTEPGQCATYTGPGTCTNVTPPVPRRQITTTDSPIPYYVRLKVCDPGFPESETTCTVYGSSSKPTGLIHENYLKARFGAFGYLYNPDCNANNPNQCSYDGGVLRARMKDLGPEKLVPNSLPVANTRTEWLSTNGTYVTNSDPTDSSATGFGVDKSGVIQYLNKFGRRSGYKSYDQYSELVYESVKYFKNKGSTPEYSAGFTAANADGFPVIRDWDDPIQYRCQKNFIIGIADSNTWADKNLPGWSRANGDKEPTNAPSNPDDYNVLDWTSKVATSEGMGGLLNFRTCGGFCQGSAALAGIAYYAHTQDLRGDHRGKQTITSFFIDVREFGSWGYTGDPRNQMWLASKYGGFDDKNDNGQFDAGIDEWTPSLTTLVQGQPVPSNYYAASKPDKLVASLKGAFDQINKLTQSGAGAGVSASNISTTSPDTAIYQSSYNTEDWSGSVKAYKITAVDLATGNLTRDFRWDAQTVLDTQAAGTGWDLQRTIVTAKPTYNGSGVITATNPVAFRLANLSTAQAAALGSSATTYSVGATTKTEQQAVLDHLRGDKTFGEGGPLRQRDHLLGDIVDSEALYVQKAVEPYRDAFNPDYSTFAASKALRTPMVYVGSNDGMLHAINASVESTGNGGSERWAYIPSFLFRGPQSNYATMTGGNPDSDGLKALTKSAYSHRYYVNTTPVFRDVNFGCAGVTCAGSTASPDWRTILVGGLGKGGRGYYAIDITDPDSMTSESQVAAKVLWEFTDPDMGYSFGAPVIAKTAKWGWVVLLSSGYNNTFNTATPANQGKGYLYVLNPKTGDLLQKIGTGFGTAANPSGFAPITGWAPNSGDFTITEVYGGDLYGNLWRFDFTSATGNVPAPLKFAEAKDSAGNVQPITTAPRVDYRPADLKRYVFVGTGRYLDVTDINDSQQQTLYAFRDGTQSVPWTASTLPTGLSFPLQRSMLTQLSSLIPATAGNDPIPANGWYYQLTGVSTGPNGATPRERVHIDPRLAAGVVAFISTTPDGADPCNPNGITRIYALDFGSGKSRFTEAGTPKPYFQPPDTLVGGLFVRAGNQLRILGTAVTGESGLRGSQVNNFGKLYDVNWREILD